MDLESGAGRGLLTLVALGRAASFLLELLPVDEPETGQETFVPLSRSMGRQICSRRWDCCAPVRCWWFSAARFLNLPLPLLTM